MFTVIRFIICCIVLISSILVINKTKIKRKIIYRIVITVLSVLLFYSLSFIPIENLFVTFNSPSDAYYYYRTISDLQLIVEGNNCDLIVAHVKDATFSDLIVPKTTDGWKIGLYSDMREIINKKYCTESNTFFISIIQYKNTSDFFIQIYDWEKRELEIADNLKTKFYVHEINFENVSRTRVVYYGSLRNFDSEYKLWINDELIDLDIWNSNKMS